MKTDLTAELSGTRVRGVIAATSWAEMMDGADWPTFMTEVRHGNPARVMRVLAAAFRAAGDLRPLDIEPEVNRLMEEAGLSACHDFAARLVADAIDKGETALKNSPSPATAAGQEKVSTEA